MVGVALFDRPVCGPQPAGPPGGGDAGPGAPPPHPGRQPQQAGPGGAGAAASSSHTFPLLQPSHDSTQVYKIHGGVPVQDNSVVFVLFLAVL